MKRNDVVYILRNNIATDEVRYSVRSVVKNFPYKRIWFFGGKPEGLEPDCYVEYQQEGVSKWERSTNTVRKICQTDELTEDFWLFNDDFFIIDKVKEFPPYILGSLDRRVQRIFNKHHASTGYSRKLSDTQRILKQKNCDQLDYAVHCPILINRAKALETLSKFKGYPMFRSLYGNHHSIGGVVTRDFTIFGLDELPRDGVNIVSTTDQSFRDGVVGKYIRDMFKESCKYERLC